MILAQVTDKRIVNARKAARDALEEYKVARAEEYARVGDMPDFDKLDMLIEKADYLEAMYQYEWWSVDGCGCYELPDGRSHICPMCEAAAVIREYEQNLENK